MNDQRIPQPLDFVKTELGNIGIITEQNTIDSRHTYSIEFIGGGNPDNEKNSWWDEGQLSVIDNLPSILARNLIHPFGLGKKPALKTFPIK